MSHIPASGSQFFQFFRRLFKVETALPYSGNVFLISFTRLARIDFLPSFWSVLFHCQQKPLFEKAENSFQRKNSLLSSLIFWLEGITFFFIFQRLLPVIVCFPSNGSAFFNEILDFNKWERIFQLMKTVFFCSEFFL